MVTANSKEELYLENSPQLTLADVYSARVEPVNWSPEILSYYKKNGFTPPTSQILITFTQQGKAKLYTVTSKNINRQLGIIINGQLVMAPIIKEPVSMGEISIQGSMSEEEMKALVERINKAKGH
jgi:preprotein translocase subunit SecD